EHARPQRRHLADEGGDPACARGRLRAGAAHLRQPPLAGASVLSPPRLRAEPFRLQERAVSWAATILTLFPEMFPGPLDVSLLGRARQRGLWSLEVRDIRDHGLGKHRTVDDTPSGGGPGMVMRADVASAALDAVERAGRPLIYLSPRGAPLTQARVRALAE